MANAPEPLSDAELASLDASYRPFPAFSDWPRAVPRNELLDTAVKDLQGLKEVTDPSALAHAVDVTIRTAAFDTGAIEGLYSTDRGLTRTVATQAAMWEQEVESRSSNALELFEAQLKAYELVLDVATNRMPVTEAWIRRVHEEITSPQKTYIVHTPIGPQEQPLPHGDYKRHPNHVETADGVVHVYAPVDLTPSEMARLVEELRSDAFAAAHPVVQAAYAHYALAAVHPFADGNGRVARAVASVYLYRGLSVPLLVLAEQRSEYFRSLRLADEGSPEAFVALVSDAARNALAMVTESLRVALAPRPEDALQSIRNLLIAQGGLTHKELDSVAVVLADTVRNALAERISELDFPPGVSGEVQAGVGTLASNPPDGFRRIVDGGGRFVVLSLRSSPPAEAARDAQLEILVSMSRDEAQTFRVQVQGGDGLTFGLREVTPDLSSSAQYRLGAFVDRLVGTEMNELFLQAERSLEAVGYRREQPIDG
jgi:Fic family protein